MPKTTLSMWMSFAITPVLVLGCTSEGEGEASAHLSGDAVYRDASTDHAGNTRPASPPPAQSAKVTVTVKGTGQIPNVDPQCALDPAGQFEASYLSTLSIDGDEAYLAAFGAGSGTIATPSGCAIPTLTVGVVTDVTVRAELAITTQNCETYCQANARAEAEATCGASAAAAECRASAETQTAARCTTTCTTRANKIVAETSIGVSTLGSLDAEALKAAALGELEANLVFDTMVDANGVEL